MKPNRKIKVAKLVMFASIGDKALYQVITTDAQQQAILDLLQQWDGSVKLSEKPDECIELLEVSK